jgi:hypothetical protein
VRCPRCGNENSDSNRFCGMCGGTLLPAPAPVAAAADRVAATGPSTPARPNPSPSRDSGGVQDSPVISGPSFLGLNDPGPRRNGGLSDDPRGSPRSGNLDYLLQDEEEPSSGGGAKFVLILLALALAVGFGYLRWKNHGLPWLNLGANKPAATQSSDGNDANSTPPAASSAPSSAPSSTASTPPPSIAAAPETPAAQPAADSTTNTATPAASHPTTNPATGSVPANAAPTNTPTPSGDAANSADNSSATPAPTHKGAKDKDADKDADEADSNSPPAASSKSNEAVAAPAPAPKPHAAIPRAALADNVAEAQKYIYGRGVAQDCERGMRLLKPAANQSNPKAMVEMGALYSAGLCTPHDLPTAYRWFALALRKDPDNQAVQTDLQKLWGEMTQPERQLAIKLSQ